MYNIAGKIWGIGGSLEW